MKIAPIISFIEKGVETAGDPCYIDFSAGTSDVVKIMAVGGKRCAVFLADRNELEEALSEYHTAKGVFDVTGTYFPREVQKKEVSLFRDIIAPQIEKSLKRAPAGSQYIVSQEDYSDSLKLAKAVGLDEVFAFKYQTEVKSSGDTKYAVAFIDDSGENYIACVNVDDAKMKEHGSAVKVETLKGTKKKAVIDSLKKCAGRTPKKILAGRKAEKEKAERLEKSRKTRAKNKRKSGKTAK